MVFPGQGLWRAGADRLCDAAWQNLALSRKLAAQLAVPFAVAAGTLPAWCRALPRAYPFLFAFEARRQLLRCGSIVDWLKVATHHRRRRKSFLYL